MPPFERGEAGVVVCPHVLRNEIEIVPGLVLKNAIYEIVYLYIGSIPPYLWEHLLRVYRGEEGCTSSGKITVPPRGHHSRYGNGVSYGHGFVPYFLFVKYKFFVSLQK